MDALEKLVPVIITIKFLYGFKLIQLFNFSSFRHKIKCNTEGGKKKEFIHLIYKHNIWLYIFSVEHTEIRRWWKKNSDSNLFFHRFIYCSTDEAILKLFSMYYWVDELINVLMFWGTPALTWEKVLVSIEQENARKDLWEQIRIGGINVNS